MSKFKIKPIYTTAEITNSFGFKKCADMNLNEVLLRILGDDEYFYYNSMSLIGYDIVWIKKDMVEAWDILDKTRILQEVYQKRVS